MTTPLRRGAAGLRVGPGSRGSDAGQAVLSEVSDLSDLSDELAALPEPGRTAHGPDRANALRGLEFPAGTRVLHVGAGHGAVTRYLAELPVVLDAIEADADRAAVVRRRCGDLPVEVFVADLAQVPAEADYDVVVALDLLGGADPAAALERARALLAPGGALVLGADNALGARYLAGMPDVTTGRVADSLEGYPSGRGAARSRREVLDLLAAVGLRARTLAVFPDLTSARVVMDVAALPASAARLAHALPTFPSPSPAGPWVERVSEALLWRELCRAGLGPDTPNAFLVVAAVAEPGLWPSGLLARMDSVGRARSHRVVTTVRADADGVLLTRTPVDPAARAVVGSTEPFAGGVDLLEWAAGAADDALAAALGAWADLVRRHARAGTLAPDLVPHNLARHEDGSVVAFDQEWAAGTATETQVLTRGLVWFAWRLCPATRPERWPGAATIGDVARHLGRLIGVTLDDEALALFVRTEAELQAAALVGADEGAAAIAAREADVRSVIDHPLAPRCLPDRDVRPLAAALDRVGAALAGATADLDRVTADLDRATAERAAAAAERDRAAADLAALTSSRAIRAARAYQRGVERLAPAGTRRRRAHGSLVTGLGRVARWVRRRGGAGAPAAPPPQEQVVPSAPRTPEVSAPEPPVPPVPAAPEPSVPEPTPDPAPEPPLVLPTSPAPLVSVVVPVHGQWEVTRRCLESFVAHPPTVPFEVVVVDDASPDDTRARLAAVSGVRVVALDANRGYIGATNAGLAVAAGEWVALLNNDTEITEGWLEALLATAGEPGVGLVGSKLVYPDGTLQEAGAMIFADGGGWNFGRGGDAALERYNHVRDVDYCSAAAVLIRRALLTELGGLDEAYAPAYFDDVELAFRLRERGLRVVYQPAAVVVHHEGVSHGTDPEAGTKAYEAVNRRTFVERWAHRLADHYPARTELIEAAARRLDGRGTVVVVDFRVPRPDEDSGSVRLYGLLRTLRRLGYAVVFVPHDRDPGGAWGERLRAEGVEVFVGPEPLEPFLAALSSRVVAVIGARVGVVWEHFLAIRRALPGVPFLFDTVDLHHLREERAAELSGDPGLRARAAATRSLELGLVAASEVTLVVSPAEVEALAAEAPGARVLVVPNVHEIPEPGPGPAERSGLVFVGSYGHHPNVDAVEWFVTEVFPLVRAEVPDAHLTVVGKGLPDDVAALCGDGVTVAGWVPDLTETYRTTRVAVAPLRYGAGIKGKVGEALSHGVPVVATTVAAEGMGVEHGVSGWVADEAADFAAGVVRLLRDDGTWTAVAEEGRRLVERTLGVARFEATVVEALTAAGLPAP